MPTPFELVLQYLDTVMDSQVEAAKEAINEMLYAIKIGDETLENEYKEVYHEYLNTCREIVTVKKTLQEIVKKNEERIQKKNPRYIEV